MISVSEVAECVFVSRLPCLGRLWNHEKWGWLEEVGHSQQTLQAHHLCHNVSLLVYCDVDSLSPDSSCQTLSCAHAFLIKTE